MSNLWINFKTDYCMILQAIEGDVAGVRLGSFEPMYSLKAVLAAKV